jgi:ankyrin repeat protein
MNQLRERPKAKKAAKLDLAKQKLPTDNRKLNLKKQKRLNQNLIDAAVHGNNPEIERLLRLGADVNAKSRFNDWTALMWAAYDGNMETCALLLKNGADLKESGGWTAYMCAESNGKTETAELLRLYHIRNIVGEKAVRFLSVFNECVSQ